MHAYAPAYSPYLTSVEDAPSLTAVLAAMGHQCRGSCPAESAKLKAVWYAVRGRQVGSVGLVLVDIFDHDYSAADSAQLLADVNTCTRADRIRVRLHHGWASKVVWSS